MNRYRQAGAQLLFELVRTDHAANVAHSQDSAFLGCRWPAAVARPQV
jgi:hypothetical protein